MNQSTPSTGEGAGAWYRSAFDRLYPLIYRHRDDGSAQREIDALLGQLDVPPGGRALDIACGAGRHLKAMRAAGLAAVGVDLSQALLREAAERRGLGGQVAEADVRALPFDGAFDLAVNLFTSFGYFADEAENAAALRRMAGVLRVGGLLVVDHVNRAHLERHLIAEDERQVNGLTVFSQRRIEDDRMIKRMSITQTGGQAPERIIESVRLYRPAEMAAAFEAAGLAVERMVGSFDGEPLTDESSRMITIGVRR